MAEQDVQENSIKTFKGTNNIYAEIAQRGKLNLGLSMEYFIHKGVGGLILHFVVVPNAPVSNPEEIGTFKELKPRGEGNFLKEDGTQIKGIRLTKVFIPLFKPGPNSFAFSKMAEKFQIWEIIADWVSERIKTEDFSLIHADIPLRNIIVSNLDGSLQADKDDTTELVLTFPEFNPQQQEEEE